LTRRAPTDDELRRLLPTVQKPARYTGGEYNAWNRDPGGRLNVCWCFPDLYEIGMSHHGGRLIYDRLNRRDDACCDRAFLPADDMAALMEDRGWSLFSLEQRRPLAEFDVLAVTLSYELSFSGLLYLLELAGLPLKAAARRADPGMPLVLAGGPAVLNPEPIVPFVDACLIGESEAFWSELVGVVTPLKGEAGLDKAAVMERLIPLSGAYAADEVPVETAADGRLVPTPAAGAVNRRTAALDPYIERPLVPGMDIVHDRVNVEVMRGCTGGCRFCQAGMTYRPVRSLSSEAAFAELKRQLELTGYAEANVSSLSSTDWRGLAGLVRRIMSELPPKEPVVGFPSLRVSETVIQLESMLSGRRRGSLTIAPEAGSERLRRVINKPAFTNDELVELSAAVFAAEFATLKLYFMFGLPGETDDDLRELIELAKRCAARAGAKQKVNVALSPFIPKPHTPFQWAPQPPLEELERRLRLLLDNLRAPRLKAKWNSPKMAVVEAALSRGDRRVAEALIEARRRGARFEAWDEHFDLDRWRSCFAAAGLDLVDYAIREYAVDERLAWDAVDNLVTKRFLAQEYERSRSGEITPDCRRTGCNVCGIEPSSCEHGGLDELERELRRLVLYPPENSFPPSQLRFRVRLEFAKTWPASALSQLELKKVLIQAVRRAGYRPRLSSGYNPQPRLTIALPLPVGVESRAEVAEIELNTWFDAEVFLERINALLPPGLAVNRAVELPAKAPKLSAGARVARYLARCPEAPAELDRRVGELLNQSEIRVERTKKSNKKNTNKNETREVEVRNSLVELRSRGGLLSFTLEIEPSVPALRVDELIELLGFPAERAPLVERTAVLGRDTHGKLHDLFHPALLVPPRKSGKKSRR